MPINKRNLAVSIILSIVTCGIYSLYWFVVLTDDTRNVSNDAEGSSGGVALLLTIVTCGIYGFYWAYKQGERIDNAKAMRGMATGGSSNILFLVLQIFGMGIVNYILIQDALNKIADNDMFMNGGGYGPNGPMNGGMYNNGPMYNGPMNNGPMNGNGYGPNGPMNGGGYGPNGPMNDGQMNNGPMNNDPNNMNNQ